MIGSAARLGYLLLAATITGACSDSGRTILADVDRNQLSLNPSDGTVVVRVGNGTYHFGDDPVPYSEEQIEKSLSAALEKSANKRIDVRLYADARPYYAVVLLNTAAAVGFVEATGMQHYKDDASLAEREAWVEFPLVDLTAVASRVRADAARGRSDQAIQ